MSKSTIYNVAEAAGVSIKTVSRVLRNEAKVSEETRERVRTAMRELNYSPHPGARSLASLVPHVIGLLTAAPLDYQAARRGNEYRMALQMGALTAADPLGFALRLVVVRLPASGNGNLDELIAMAKSGAVGGFLVAPPLAENRAILNGLADAGVASVVIGTSDVPATMPSVTPDERAAMRQLMRSILDLGHRRIAIVPGRPGWHATEMRMAGCLDALVSAGLELDSAYVAGAGFDFETGERAGEQLLSMPERPTAILAFGDDSAAGVIAAAHKKGIDVPGQLSVTGFDDLDLARKLWPPLTTIRHPIERMAELAAKRLISTMQPQRRNLAGLPLRVEVTCEFVQRGSLAAPPR